MIYLQLFLTYLKIGFFGFGEHREYDVSGGITLVAQQVRKHYHACHRHSSQGTHRVKCLGKIQTSSGVFFISQRQDERVGSCFEKCQSEGQDIKAEAEKREALSCCSRDEKQRADGIKRQTEQDSAFIAVFLDE